MKIDIAPKTIKIEIPNYGDFEVLPLGAGAEAELRIASRKINELTKETKKYEELVKKEEANEDVDRESEEYSNALKAYRDLTEAYQDLKDITLEKMRACFKGKNIEKLFTDFTYEQILEIHGKAMAENE